MYPTGKTGQLKGLGLSQRSAPGPGFVSSTPPYPYWSGIIKNPRTVRRFPFGGLGFLDDQYYNYDDYGFDYGGAVDGGGGAVDGGGGGYIDPGVMTDPNIASDPFDFTNLVLTEQGQNVEPTYDYQVPDLGEPHIFLPPDAFAPANPAFPVAFDTQIDPGKISSPTNFWDWLKKGSVSAGSLPGGSGGATSAPKTATSTAAAGGISTTMLLLLAGGALLFLKK